MYNRLNCQYNWQYTYTITDVIVRRHDGLFDLVIWPDLEMASQLIKPFGVRCTSLLDCFLTIVGNVLGVIWEASGWIGFAVTIICHPSRSFQGDAAGYAITTTTTTTTSHGIIIIVYYATKAATHHNTIIQDKNTKCKNQHQNTTQEKTNADINSLAGT